MHAKAMRSLALSVVQQYAETKECHLYHKALPQRRVVPAQKHQDLQREHFQN